MSPSFLDFATAPTALQELLENLGLAEPEEMPLVEPLAGGVSSGIFRVALRSGTYCVKQALPKLKVEKDWTVPTDRVFSEIAWLQAAERIVPGHVPRVLGVNQQAGAFVMEFLHEDSYRNWKTALLSGLADEGAGRMVASVLSRIHAATAGDLDVSRAFSNRGNFYLLRLEPYLIEAARQNPDVADELISLVHSVQTHSLALVHGDVSPKNILLGPDGPVLLDAECACFGDPAFDLAFLLNHLLLKSVCRPRSQAALLVLFKAIYVEYLVHVTWEPKQELEKRVARLLPGLLLARVDGKSPVEYLSQAQQSSVRTRARALLQCPQDGLEGLIQAWSAFESEQVVSAMPNSE